MAEHQTDRMTNGVAEIAGSRRAALSAAVGAAVGGLLRAFAAPAETRARRRKPKLTGRCAAEPTGTVAAGGDWRAAQTFIASRSGTLKQVRVAIRKEPGVAGNYIVQVVPVTAGVPDHVAVRVFAASAIDDADVPDGNSTLVANFAGASLLAGEDYAIVVTRIGVATLTVRTANSDTSGCSDSTMFSTFESDQFFSNSESDMIFSVFVK